MFHGLGLLATNRYVMDLSNEVLNVDFGQDAAKNVTWSLIFKIKVIAALNEVYSGCAIEFLH